MADKTIDQMAAEILAIGGDKSKLAAGVTMQADLVTASNAVATLTANIATLTGDKTKLAEGATLPVSLVEAGNSIATLTKQLADANAKVTKLESEKTTVDKAVAAKIAELGISDKGAKAADKKDEPKLTLTQQCLKANGRDIKEAVQIGYGAGANTDGGATAE